jgi:hypothetical protein
MGRKSSSLCLILRLSRFSSPGELLGKNFTKAKTVDIGFPNYARYCDNIIVVENYTGKTELVSIKKEE